MLLNKKTLKRVHVHQHTLRRNIKLGERNPCLTVQTAQGPLRTHRVTFYCSCGKAVADLIESLDKPLSCGARIWIETRNPVELAEEEN